MSSGIDEFSTCIFHEKCSLVSKLSLCVPPVKFFRKAICVFPLSKLHLVLATLILYEVSLMGTSDFCEEYCEVIIEKWEFLFAHFFEYDFGVQIVSIQRSLAYSRPRLLAKR